MLNNILLFVIYTENKFRAGMHAHTVWTDNDNAQTLNIH
jgi:hypothetical protein